MVFGQCNRPHFQQLQGLASLLTPLISSTGCPNGLWDGGVEMPGGLIT